MQNRENYLSMMTALKSLGADEIESYVPADALQARRLNTGEQLVRVGDADHQLYMVMEGLLKIVFVPDGGREYIRAFLSENMFYVAYTSYLTRQPNQCYVEAIENTRMCAFPFSLFYRGLDSSLSLNLAWRHYMEKHFIRHEQRELDLLSRSAKERYLQFRKDYASFQDRLPQHLIASYLGITQQSLSRIRRELD